MSGDRPVARDTWVVNAGRPTAPGEPLNWPLAAASTFVHGGERQYARDDASDAVDALEAVVGGLEGGRGLAFSSGMAAAAAVFDGLAVGSRIAIPDDCYQGVAALAADGAARGRWTVGRLPLSDTGGWVAAAADHDLLWLESPSNPLLGVADLPTICGADRPTGCAIVVDNTFATPYNQRPLAYGADLVMHSATKFIGGHSDLLAGIIIGTDDARLGAIERSRLLTGAMPGTLEAWLALRGVRTLGLRIAKAQNNAAELAERLNAHDRVAVVRYPGLAHHPDHALAAKTLEGFGTMISFDVAGTAADADAVLSRLEVIVHATSLGGVESTIERRAVIAGQEHLPATLLRLSVGCEDVADLWADLDAALTG